MIDFTGQTVLVGGGSSGIGLGIARRFEAAGALVHITGTRAGAGDYSDTDLDGLVFHQLDVAEAGTAARLSAQLDGVLHHRTDAARRRRHHPDVTRSCS